MKRMRTVFLWTAPVVSSIAIAVNRHPDLRIVTSTPSADLAVLQSSSLHPKYVHSGSGPIVQFRISWLQKLPKKCKRTIEVRKRSRKAPLPMSHNIVSGSDRLTPKNSPLDSGLEATYYEINPELNTKTKREESTSIRGTTNNRLEPESFDDVVTRQRCVREKNMMVSILNAVETKPELSRDNRRFSKTALEIVKSVNLPAWQSNCAQLTY